MSLFQAIKRHFSKLAYSFFSHAPSSWERKYSILMDILSTDMRRFRKFPVMVLDFASQESSERVLQSWKEEGLDDEFLNTYPFLRNLGIPYKYKILSLCPPWENHELTLLAWPCGLEK